MTSRATRPYKSEMFAEPQFGELPAAKRGRVYVTAYGTIIAALKERPGKWAQIGLTRSTGAATAINRGHRGFVPAGAFEACTRIDPDHEHPTKALWVRYVGSAPPPEQEPAPTLGDAVIAERRARTARPGAAPVKAAPVRATDDTGLLCTDPECQHPKRRHNVDQGGCAARDCLCTRTWETV